MDKSWERAVEAAFNGETDAESVRTLTLDGAVKCVNGRLPPPSLLEKFHNLEHLSMANIGVSSLEQFPGLKNLQKLILSDNRIAGGLEFLVEAGLQSLSVLDLSNNRISRIQDLQPLAKLRLLSLDLYECPVTRVKDYRFRVFGLIKSLKYLDNMDAEENERPESDEEEEDEEEEDDDAYGEIVGEDHTLRPSNGLRSESDGVVDVDEDENSDTDEEGGEASRAVNGRSQGPNSNQHSNGFKEDVQVEEDVAEAYEDEMVDDEDGVEAHEVDYEDDGVEGEDDEDQVLEYSLSSRQYVERKKQTDAICEFDDDANEDDDGETGEEAQAFGEGDFEDEEVKDELEDDNASSYLVQPISQVEVDAEATDTGEDEDPEVEEDSEEDDDDDDDQDGEVQELPPSSHKRRRDWGDDNDGDGSEEDDSDDDDDDGGGDEDDGDEDGLVPQQRSSKSSRL